MKKEKSLTKKKRFAGLLSVKIMLSWLISVSLVAFNIHSSPPLTCCGNS